MNNILNSPSVLEHTTKKSFSWKNSEYTLLFSNSIDTLSDVWPDKDVANALMSLSYLKVIEHAPPQYIEFLYGVLYNSSNAIIGFYYFQYKQFNAKESINYPPAKNWRQRWLNSIKQSVSSIIDARGLVSGNLLVTGDHGKICLAKNLAELECEELYTEVQYQALLHSNLQGPKVKFVLAKDFEHEPIQNEKLPWNAVRVQPNMVMDMRSNWDSMEAYLDDMTSKYKKRTKTALRKASKLRFEDVNVETIEANIDWIYSLYLEIVDRAPFNMFILSKSYFIAIKRILKDDCDFTFVYDEEKLIAFQINLTNGELYEAHFLGYNHAYLRSHDLYLNLLLNTVRLAIKRKKSTTVFSRTAMQIKSSIGAVPEELYLYLNVQNKMLNALVRLAFKYLKPPAAFEQRHPFKK